MEESTPKRYIISIVNYEGGLTGLSSGNDKKFEFHNEFNFKASDSALNCISGQSHLVATGGSSEIVQIYNLQTKKECGDLYGHKGSITSVAISPDT